MIRYQAVILGGCIAGLAGAWFSLEAQGGFEDNMTNGAGFIALAAMIFGKWRPWCVVAPCSSDSRERSVPGCRS